MTFAVSIVSRGLFACMSQRKQIIYVYVYSLSLSLSLSIEELPHTLATHKEEKIW